MHLVSFLSCRDTSCFPVLPHYFVISRVSCVVPKLSLIHILSLLLLSFCHKAVYRLLSFLRCRDTSCFPVLPHYFVISRVSCVVPKLSWYTHSPLLNNSSVMSCAPAVIPALSLNTPRSHVAIPCCHNWCIFTFCRSKLSGFRFVPACGDFLSVVDGKNKSVLVMVFFTSFLPLLIVMTTS